MKEACSRCDKLGGADCSEGKLRLEVDRLDISSSLTNEKMNQPRNSGRCCRNNVAQSSSLSFSSSLALAS